MKSLETTAGDACTEMHRRVSGGDWTRQLPSHIRTMLGHNDFGQPLWQRREMPPEGKLFELDRFEDYLTKPFRQGLGFKSWWTIHCTLETQGADGLSAIAMIKAEIGSKNYNDRVEKDRWRILGEGRATRDEIGGRPAKDEKVSDSYLSKSGTNTRRIIGRLKRDAPEIAEQLARGEFKSAAAAARAAGFKIDPSAISQLRRWWRRAPEDERAAFLKEIRNGGEDKRR